MDGRLDSGGNGESWSATRLISEVELSPLSNGIFLNGEDYCEE